MAIDKDQARNRLANWAVEKRTRQGLTGDDSPLGKSYVSKVEKCKIVDIPIHSLSLLAEGLNTTIDEPLREMGYFAKDAVVVQGGLGRFLRSYQALPEEWQGIVSELTAVLYRRLQEDRKRNEGRR